MSNGKYTICIYIPGISYVSIGPGFIDAIKLEARNAQYPETTYKVYTKHCTDLENNTSTDQNSSIYRCVDPTKAVDGSKTHPVASVQYVANEKKRSPHGYFYDFVQPDPSGTFKHTLTCFSNLEMMKGLTSFDQNSKDGLFIIETDEADAQIELIFTFYTLSYDQYNADAKNTHIYTEPISYPKSLDNYIVIGTMTKIIRASTMSKNIDVEMAAADGLQMYYDINAGPDQMLYLPINGGDFVPIIGIDGGELKKVTPGSDIFTPYVETEGSIQWPNPKFFTIQDELTQIFTADAVATCGFGVGANVLGTDGMGSFQYPQFSNPTKVNIGTQHTTSKSQQIVFSISDIDATNVGTLWSSAPLYAVQNVTYNPKFQDVNRHYATAALIEYVPDLSKIQIANPEDINIMQSVVSADTSKQMNYSRNATHMGRVFSDAMSKLPYNTYSVSSYISNFGNSEWPDKQANSIFIDRPHYMDNPNVSVENALFSNTTEQMINEKTTAGVLYIDNEAYTISSDIQYSSISKSNQLPQTYPLLEYFKDNDRIKTHITEPVQVEIKHINGDTVLKSKDITYIRTISQDYYYHVFSCEDTKNLPNILGNTKQFINSPFISLQFQTDVFSPVLKFERCWNTGYLYTTVSGSDIDESLTAVSPSYNCHNISDRLSDIVSWARRYDMGAMPAQVCSNSKTIDMPKYVQELVLSPRLIIDMDMSNTTFLNRGDYKIIPAYYYGDCSNPNAVLTDYKRQECNIDLNSAIYIDYNSEYQKWAGKYTFDYDVVSSFQILDDVYTLSHDNKYSDLYIENMIVTIPETVDSGIYVLKFHKYFEHNGISLHSDDCKLQYTINDKSYTSNKDFIVIYISPQSIGKEHVLKFNFGVEGIGKIKIGNFALYKIKQDDTTDLNQILLNWWYARAIEQSWGNLSEPTIIPENNNNDFYKVLYDNIIFPSAICAYEDWSIFVNSNDGTFVPGYTKQYNSMYFPKIIQKIDGKDRNIASIYSIIGNYNIQNIQISNVEGLPNDLTSEEKNNIICINQPSRYV